MTITDRDFDPSKIRKCELIDDGKDLMIQFIAISDRHKMMCGNDGEIVIIPLTEQGMDYKYGQAVPIAEALKILKKGMYETHIQMARQIEFYVMKLRNTAPMAGVL